MRRSSLNLVGVAALAVIILVVGSSFRYLFFEKPFYKAESWDSGDGSWGAFTEEGSFEYDDLVETLVVSTVAGPIAVKTWSDSRIQVNWRKSAPSAAQLKRLTVYSAVSGKKLTLKPDFSRNIFNSGMVSFTVMIPESVKLVEAEAVSGAVSITGLAPSSRAEVSTTSGKILVTGGRGLEAGSISGRIDFELDGGVLKAETTSGLIRGTLKGFTERDRVEASSVSGRVALTLPPGISADVDLRSVSGSLECEFPLAVEESGKGRLRGVIGDGGGPIAVDTVSGSISLQSRGE